MYKNNRRDCCLLSVMASFMQLKCELNTKGGPLLAMPSVRMLWSWRLDTLSLAIGY